MQSTLKNGLGLAVVVLVGLGAGVAGFYGFGWYQGLRAGKPQAQTTLALPQTKPVDFGFRSEVRGVKIQPNVDLNQLGQLLELAGYQPGQALGVPGRAQRVQPGSVLIVFRSLKEDGANPDVIPMERDSAGNVEIGMGGVYMAGLDQLRLYIYLHPSRPDRPMDSSRLALSWSSLVGRLLVRVIPQQLVIDKAMEQVGRIDLLFGYESNGPLFELTIDQTSLGRQPTRLLGWLKWPRMVRPAYAQCAGTYQCGSWEIRSTCPAGDGPCVQALPGVWQCQETNASCSFYDVCASMGACGCNQSMVSDGGSCTSSASYGPQCNFTGACTEGLYNGCYTPSGPGPTPTPAPGGWGSCGSCSGCGGPQSECVLDPDGYCVWDSAGCGPPPPTPTPAYGRLEGLVRHQFVAEVSLPRPRSAR
jgi:hypothetical protein